MKAVMVVNGRTDPELLRRWSKYPVMAVDGGLQRVHAAGVAPRWILGDFDSVEPELLDCYRSTAEIISFPVDKDHTDLELAVLYMANKPVSRLLVFGLSGGLRWDHQLAAWLLLSDLAARGCLVQVFTPGQVHYISPRARILQPSAGRYFSVQTIRGPGRISVSGARYNGKNISLIPGSGHGLGNAIKGDFVKIDVHQGCVCISQWMEE